MLYKHLVLIMCDDKIITSVLTIAGSDSCGGAGIQADLKTFSSIGVYGSSVITSITAQNTTCVNSIYDLPLSIIEDQFETIMDDLKIKNIKIGMLSSSDIVITIEKLLRKYDIENIVLDPVMVSESGGKLLKEDAILKLKEILIPKVNIITPNIKEAEVLSGLSINSINDAKYAALKISDLGSRYVIIKGGHLNGNDLLYDSKNDTYDIYNGEYINNSKYGYHGTGCTYSSALVSYLELGNTIKEACKLSKKFVLNGIINSKKIGKGSMPVYQKYIL